MCDAIVWRHQFLGARTATAATVGRSPASADAVRRRGLARPVVDALLPHTHCGSRNARREVSHLVDRRPRDSANSAEPCE
jgi:hypothetical protein